MRGGGGGGLVHQRFVILQASGVIQQVANGDGFSVGGEIREDVGQGLVVAKLTVVDEQHDGHGGELFGAGSETEVGVGVDFWGAAQVADAVAAFEKFFAVF